MSGDVKIKNLIASSKETSSASTLQHNNGNSAYNGANTSTNYNANPFKKVPKLHLYKKDRRL